MPSWDFSCPPHASGEFSQEASSLSVNARMNRELLIGLLVKIALVSAGRGGWTLHLECPALNFGEVVEGVGL